MESVSTITAGVKIIMIFFHKAILLDLLSRVFYIKGLQKIIKIRLGIKMLVANILQYGRYRFRELFQLLC